MTPLTTPGIGSGASAPRPAMINQMASSNIPTLRVRVTTAMSPPPLRYYRDASRRAFLAVPFDSIVDHRVRFEFHQPVGIDETRDLHDGVRRPDITEELTVYRRDSLPVVDSSQQRPRPDHMAQRRSGRLERRGDDVQASARLDRCITFPHRTAGGAERRGARYRDHVPGSHRS